MARLREPPKVLRPGQLSWNKTSAQRQTLATHMRSTTDPNISHTVQQHRNCVKHPNMTNNTQSQASESHHSAHPGAERLSEER